jgi:release factor glutamine methyltransferase
MIASLDPEVRDFDPIAALDGGEDGLDCYRCLAAKARDHLEEAGRIAVEIGCDQRLDVAMIFGQAGYALISERRDLAGHDRVLVFSATVATPAAAVAA